MVYPCLHFIRNHEDLKPYTPYLECLSAVLKIKVKNILEYINRAPYSKKPLIRRIEFFQYSVVLIRKNALWLYWKRGGNEEVLTEEELSDPKKTYDDVEHEVAEIFRIETDIFHFETPICKAFNKFNHLFKMDTDFHTNDIPGFKTYKEYKDD
ncbi:hypothetical protein Tco_1388172 [Tanacetum coccineum]